jgi:YVTN family beta-propeller protein
VLFIRWAFVLSGLALAGLLLDTIADSLSGASPSSGHGAATTVARSGVGATQARTSRGPGRAPLNVYAADTPGDLSPVVRHDIPMIYVPNSVSNTVTEINPATYQVVRTFPVGAQPQHVVPSWDLRTLWVTSDLGNTLTPINPVNGLPGAPVAVRDPYNMYFTPDGHYAIVVAERYRSLDFRNPHTMALVHALDVPCPGVDHLDFSADGSFLLASCEFGHALIEVDVKTQTYVKTIVLPISAQPQDVKLSPDGRTFFVADKGVNGVWKVDASSVEVTGFIPTGLGAHGLYISRDFKYLYVTNRDEGSISLIDLATLKVAAKWWLPDGGSPDMGNISDNGKVLWLSGRYNSEVYAIDTVTGQLLARIPVGGGPHGLCVWPQPGDYSLGHTGIMR